MKSTLSALALVAALGFAGAASAQVPTGGADAKGNAPLKHAHTVNDGGAKRGATSFTQKEAMRHIEHAGYTGVSGLEKGKDGVWRGTATKDGSARQVGMDFKGNVVEAGSAGIPMTGETKSADGASAHGAMASKPTGGPTAAVSNTTTNAEATTTTTKTTATAGARHHRRHHRHHRRHHGHGRCASPGVNGAACSGIDRNDNGISDKEDRAMKSGAKP